MCTFNRFIFQLLPILQTLSLLHFLSAERPPIHQHQKIPLNLEDNYGYDLEKGGEKLEPDP